MNLTPEQRKKIMWLFPVQRGNVAADNSRFLDAIISIVKNGCTWRSLPAVFAPWHTIYVRINRRAKNGRLQQIFTALRDERILSQWLRVVSLDSTSVKVHLDGIGA